MALAIGILVLRQTLQLTIAWAGPTDMFRWFVRHASFGNRTVSESPVARSLRADGGRQSGTSGRLQLRRGAPYGTPVGSGRVRRTREVVAQTKRVRNELNVWN
jgi:hypothetical protein